MFAGILHGAIWSDVGNINMEPVNQSYDICR